MISIIYRFSAIFRLFSKQRYFFGLQKRLLLGIFRVFFVDFLTSTATFLHKEYSHLWD